MSSQKGNVSRSRAQKHQNASAFRNDKYGATVQVKKAKSQVHDGLCQHCKGVLEWKVKYSKYKPLTQLRKCVKCSQRNIKDAYHVICKPCSLQLEVCCKCGKKEEIVIPINSHLDNEEEEKEEVDCQKKKSGQQKEDELKSGEEEDDLDFGDNCSEEDFDSDSDLMNVKDKTGPLDVSKIHIKD
ncbi:uncharacterized protein C9orf85 homolog [Eucyclogobius newberryi]|uniref:uncharacterized protein C9orf85 homolog n=1 Tax=Eucyclogobius newberryi TaxID=166745 RepID=UPI003B5B9614